MSNVNYREYNDLHLPIASNLICFIKGLEHAMQKTNDFDGAMHQLKCIGYDKALATVESVAHEYKEYHKQRIRAEQTADSLEVRYPKIQEDRRGQYDKNCQLIRELWKLQDCTARTEDLRCAITEKLDVDIAKVLDAYLSCDVDALISAITGWDLESLMAAAKIIPDLKGGFPSRCVNTDEIAFSLREKESLSETEFKDFLMKIIRDGKEYILSSTEQEQVYRELRHLYLCNDALRQLDEFIEYHFSTVEAFEEAFGFTYEQITTPTSALYLVDKFVAAYQNAGDCKEAENDTWQNVIRTILMRNAETIKHTYGATYRIWAVTKAGMKSHLRLVTSLHPEPYDSKEALHEDAHGYLEKVLNRHGVCNGEVLIRTEIRHIITVGGEQTGMRDWTMEVSGWDRIGQMQNGKLISL